MKIKSILLISFLSFVSFISYSQSISWALSSDLHATIHNFLFNNNKILAATDSGVYHSTDDGLTWSACNDSIPYTSSIAVDSSG